MNDKIVDFQIEDIDELQNLSFLERHAELQNRSISKKHDESQSRSIFNLFASLTIVT